VGFVLGCIFFAVHAASAWRTALRLARTLPPEGFLPRGTELGLVTGALAVLVAQGVHSIFDYRLHVPASALLVALAAGWIAAARTGLGEAAEYGFVPWWLKALGLLPALAGGALWWSLGRDWPAEQKVLESMQARERGAAGEMLRVAQEGLRAAPRNPRLLMAAGEASLVMGNSTEPGDARLEWYGRSADCFRSAVRERPLFAPALRELAITSDWFGQPAAARPVHLRAIARDPDHAKGYEYLALHFWKQGRPEEADRLFRLAQRLPGSTLAREFLVRIEEERKQAPQRDAASPGGDNF
jgi:tetratricopeptide (TPR) repeat protein